MAVGLVAAIAAWFVAPVLGPTKNGTDWAVAAQAVLAVWVLVLFWLVGRVLVVPRFARVERVVVRRRHARARRRRGAAARAAAGRRAGAARGA